jgi:hypothetical protein
MFTLQLTERISIMQFDQVTFDIALAFAPYFAGALLLDVTIILLLNRRIGTYRLNATRAANDQFQTILRRYKLKDPW